MDYRMYDVIFISSNYIFTHLVCSVDNIRLCSTSVHRLHMGQCHKIKTMHTEVHTKIIVNSIYHYAKHQHCIRPYII